MLSLKRWPRGSRQKAAEGIEERLRAKTLALSEARSAALGKTRLTPDDLKKPGKSTPTPFASLDRQGWRDAVWGAQGPVGLKPDARAARQVAWEGLQVRAVATEPSDRTVKARAYRLRDITRAGHPQERSAKCGHCVIGAPALMKNPETGTHSLGGLVVCGSVWCCPVCAMKIKAARAEEIKQAMSICRQWGNDAALMCTLTTSHHEGDSLREMREGFQRAWNAFMGKVPSVVKDLNKKRRKLGLEKINWKEELLGYVSGAEVTTGINGWHYHRHVIFAFKESQTSEQTATLRGWLKDHWREQVIEHMGAEHAPTLERGLDLRPLRLEKYIAKLGLELSDVGNKKVKSGSRSVWALAESATTGHGPDFDRFAEYCREMSGAKCVQFSSNLLRTLRRFGFRPEASDGELADESKGAELIYELTPDEWRALRETPGALYAFLVNADEGNFLPVHREKEGWGSGLRVDLDRRLMESAKERFAIQSADGVKGKTKEERRAERQRTLQKWRDIVAGLLGVSPTGEVLEKWRQERLARRGLSIELNSEQPP